VARDLSNTRLTQNQGELSRKVEASARRYSGNKVCEGRVIKEFIGFSTVVGLFGFKVGYISDRGPVSVLMEMVYHYNYITLVSFEGENHNYSASRLQIFEGHHTMPINLKCSKSAATIMAKPFQKMRTIIPTSPSKTHRYAMQSLGRTNRMHHRYADGR
jgi:hypothetical protein